MTSEDIYQPNHAETVEENIKYEGLTGNQGEQYNEQTQRDEGKARKGVITGVVCGHEMLWRAFCPSQNASGMENKLTLAPARAKRHTSPTFAAEPSAKRNPLGNITNVSPLHLWKRKNTYG